MALFNLVFWAFSVLAGPGFAGHVPPDSGFAGFPPAVAHDEHRSRGVARPMDSDAGGPS